MYIKSVEVFGQEHQVRAWRLNPSCFRAHSFTSSWLFFDWLYLFCCCWDHLGRFQFFVFTSKTTMNIYVHVFLLTYARFLSWLHAQKTQRLLGHRLYLRNILVNPTKTFSKVCLPICSSTGNVRLPVDLQPHHNFL